MKVGLIKRETIKFSGCFLKLSTEVLVYSPNCWCIKTKAASVCVFLSAVEPGSGQDRHPIVVTFSAATTLETAKHWFPHLPFSLT